MRPLKELYEVLLDAYRNGIDQNGSYLLLCVAIAILYYKGIYTLEEWDCLGEDIKKGIAPDMSIQPTDRKLPEFRSARIAFIERRIKQV